MILFPLYAVVVCWFCFRWRRSWPGWASLVLGLAGIGMLSWFHRMLADMFMLSAQSRLFTSMLVAEAGLVLVLGLFIVTLPTEVVDQPCRKCNYELAGL